MITLATPKALIDEINNDIDKCQSLLYMMMDYYDDPDNPDFATRLAIIADMQESLGRKVRTCREQLGLIEGDKVIHSQKLDNKALLQRVA